MRGSSSPLDKGRAPAPEKQASPLQDLPTILGSGGSIRHLVVPSTLEAFQATKEGHSVPTGAAPASHGGALLQWKSCLGPFQQSPSVHYHSSPQRVSCQCSPEQSYHAMDTGRSTHQSLWCGPLDSSPWA